MSAILSQEEIAALSQVVQSKEGSSPAAPPVERRDFSRPLVLSNEELQNWKELMGTVGKGLGQAFSEMLKLTIQVELTSLEQVRFESVISSLADPCCVYKVKMDPLPAAGFIAIHPSVALSVVDRLLGSSGKVKFEARELRTAEKPIVDRFANRAFASLAQSIASIVKFTPSVGGLVSRRAEATFIESGDAVLFAQFSIAGDLPAGEVRFAIPFANLPNSRNQGGKKAATETKKPNVPPAILSAIVPAKIEASVTFGAGEIRLSDLLMMEPGDVITLNMKTQDLSKISIAGIPTYEGRVGQKNGKWAVEVDKALPNGRIGGKR